MVDKARPKAMDYILDTVMQFEGEEFLSWPLGASATGRAHMWLNGKHTAAARVICQLTHGDPPAADMQAAHSCGNEACVNKKHIRWATRAENEADKILHGTQVRGEASKWSKLDETDVQMIRALNKAGFSQAEISRRFSVSSSQLSRVVRKTKWSWLEDRQKAEGPALQDEGKP